MKELAQHGLDSFCRYTCTTQANNTLSELGSAYIPPALWLTNTNEDPDVGLFSPEAVCAVFTDYHITKDPSDPAYGNLSDDTYRTLNRLDRLRVQASNNSLPKPGDIAAMRRAFARQQDNRNTFNTLPAPAREALAQRALPFLRHVALALLKDYPDLENIRNIRGLLPKPADRTFPKAGFAYELDQGYNGIARKILSLCPGVWAYKPNQKKTTVVCPIGSPRDERYQTAQKNAAYQQNDTH